MEGNDTNPKNPLAPDENQRDITTQLVVSIALGLIAFLTFCVRLAPITLSVDTQLMIFVDVVSTTKMDGPVRRPKKAEECRSAITRVTRLLLRVDTGTLQDYRGRNFGVGWSRCLCRTYAH